MRSRGPSPRQTSIQSARQRAAGKVRWMQYFAERARELGAPVGQLDWDSAQHLYSEGIGPHEAADRVYARR